MVRCRSRACRSLRRVSHGPMTGREATFERPAACDIEATKVLTKGSTSALSKDRKVWLKAERLIVSRVSFVSHGETSTVRPSPAARSQTSTSSCVASAMTSW